MNLANTIRGMHLTENKNKPPFDTGKEDYAGAAKRIRDYAKKSGGIDKSDMLSIANQLDALAKRSTPKLLARTMANIGSLDTDVRDKIKQLMKESNCMEALELDEAMVRGKEVFDKTFANKTQADNFAQKNGGRVKKVGRVFYVFKESNAEDEAPASPDEGSMAKTQLEFIEYAAEEIADHIESGKRFPEWMQNKLSQAHEKMKGLHAALGDHGDEEMNEDFELDEAKSKEQQIADLEKMLDRISGNTSSVKMKKVALQRKIDKLKNEELEENNTAPRTAAHRRAQMTRNPSKSGGSGYDLYHKDFSSAMKHAYDYAKSKLGVDIDPKEIDDKVASGPRKPSKGKTNTYRLTGKDGKKAVQIQVYGMDNGKYELNMYKESVELDENAGLIKDYQGMKAQGKKDHNILDVLMSMPKYKRMSKDQMAKIIGDAKRKGIFKEEVELDEAYKTPAEAKAYEDGKKAVAKKVSYDDNPNKKGTKEYTAWSKGHNDARARMIGKRHTKEEVEMNEEVNLDELKKYDKNADFRVLNRLSQKQKTGNLTPAEKKQMDNAKSRLRNHGVTEEIDEELNQQFDALFEEQTFGGVTHSKSVLDAITSVVEGRKVKKEDNTNDKSDDGEGMDKVQPKALKKKFKDRKDKDIDNDGDVDDSDEYLHKRRKTVSKEIGKDDEDTDTPPKKKSPPQKGKKGNGASEPVDVNPTLDEEEMSSVEKEKKDEIMKSLEKRKEEFEKKYGDRAKEVMARTAIKMAKKHA